MCGIVGLFLKEKRLYPKLGDLLSDMLITLSDRGPDSTGIAVYSAPSKGKIKLTVQSPKAKSDFSSLVAALKNGGIKASLETKNSHAVIKTGAKAKTIREFLAVNYPDIRVMGVGERVEIYKEVGLPKEVVGRFGIRGMSGSHAIGHTRMATESAVTTLGAHPFSTGDDQCLVHNGSLSNHNNLRRRLVREGMSFETYNDTEVAAAYLTAEMAKGKNLGDALKGALDALDGFFTFVVGTKSGFGVVRDPIACKPAVMAETGQYIAFGSEYRALVALPDIETARVWEPEPATVYFWDQKKAA
ncbi:MAG: glutamine amidotransferase [Hyphomicrobiales bacterium]|nr:glutamine amidotransferase [Hyphomicrobiales bacterium]MBV9520227.1 glutamine amidotransferase [Hyphomicrobiales bacterium]